MDDHGTDDGTDASPGVAPDAPHPLAAEIVLARDEPPACTVFPRGATASERLTAWITATGDAFVSAEDMR
ncbi:MAG: transcriptional regulator [Haloferacaceae archaeon]